MQAEHALLERVPINNRLYSSAERFNACQQQPIEESLFVRRIGVCIH